MELDDLKALMAASLYATIRPYEQTRKEAITKSVKIAINLEEVLRQK